MSDLDRLNDYKDPETLRRYKLSADPYYQTRYHTLYSLLPDIRGKVLLDIPCGVGMLSRRAVTAWGARKVIACDIVAEQIRFAEEKNIEENIPAGVIEYFVHDALESTILSNELADVALCVHLLCFARTEDELRRMARCIYMNMKPGAFCYVLMCSLARDPAVVAQLGEYVEVLEIGPWTGDDSRPRTLRYQTGGFVYDSGAWEYAPVCDALRAVGFQQVKLHPYIANPDYDGPLDLQRYLRIVNGAIIVARR